MRTYRMITPQKIGSRLVNSLKDILAKDEISRYGVDC